MEKVPDFSIEGGAERRTYVISLDKWWDLITSLTAMYVYTTFPIGMPDTQK